MTAGFWPTFRKSWHRPQDEPDLPYTLWACGSIASIFAIEAYTFANIIYPAFVAVINIAFVALLFLRRKKT